MKGSKHEFIKNVDNSIVIVLSKMADVNEASIKVQIDDLSIKENVNKVLEELAQNLRESLSDKAALPKLIELIRAKSESALQNPKVQIEQKRESIGLDRRR